MSTAIAASFLKALGIDPNMISLQADALINLAKSVDLRLELIAKQNDLILHKMNEWGPRLPRELANGGPRPPVVIEAETDG